MNRNKKAEALWKNAQDRLIMAKRNKYSKERFENCTLAVEMSLKALGEVRGFNYSRKHTSTIYLMRKMESPDYFITTYKDLLNEYRERFLRSCGSAEAPSDNPIKDTEEIMKWVKNLLPQEIRNIGPSLK